MGRSNTCQLLKFDGNTANSNIEDVVICLTRVGHIYSVKAPNSHADLNFELR